MAARRGVATVQPLVDAVRRQKAGTSVVSGGG